MKRGFTLIEFLLVLGIIVLIGSLASAVYSSFYLNSAASAAQQQLIAELHKAQTYSMEGDGGSGWGVAYTGGNIVLFQGNSYATRNTVFDESYSVPSAVAISGLTEIDFARMTGYPNTTTTILVAATNISYQIAIEPQGVILASTLTYTPQTISFAQLPATYYYPAANLGLSATGGASGYPVTFSASGQCTVSGSSLSITATGTCSVTANQAGNTHYATATPVTQSMTITVLVPPTVTTDGASNIATSSMTFNGTINSEQAYLYWWQYGTTTSMTSVTAEITINTGTNGTTTVSTSTGSLIPSTTYYYRFIGKNGIGQTLGAIVSSTTQSP